MRRSQLTGLVFGTAALYFAARPAEAQVWIRPSPPMMISPAPVVVAPAPVVVGSSWGGRRPYRYWAGRRYRYFPRRRVYYAPVWGRPPVMVSRRW
jgi:hypothetical protein